MLQTTANPKHMAYKGALRNQGDEQGDAWFTPKDLVRKVRRVLDGIDLDPFSSEAANEIIKARKIFTKENSAIAPNADWSIKRIGKSPTVFMNPPYSRGICARAVARFVVEYDKKTFGSGIVLVNNMTDTIWLHSLLERARRTLIFKGRISFEDDGGKRVSGNTRGQMLFLFCPNAASARIAEFERQFSKDGRIVK